jgi:hypothetical protein
MHPEPKQVSEIGGSIGRILSIQPAKPSLITSDWRKGKLNLVVAQSRSVSGQVTALLVLLLPNGQVWAGTRNYRDPSGPGLMQVADRTRSHGIGIDHLQNGTGLREQAPRTWRDFVDRRANSDCVAQDQARVRCARFREASLCELCQRPFPTQLHVLHQALHPAIADHNHIRRGSLQN